MTLLGQRDHRARHCVQVVCAGSDFITNIGNPGGLVEIQEGSLDAALEMPFWDKKSTRDVRVLAKLWEHAPFRLRFAVAMMIIEAR
jgi:hypothetical protein